MWGNAKAQLKLKRLCWNTDNLCFVIYQCLQKSFFFPQKILALKQNFKILLILLEVLSSVTRKHFCFTPTSGHENSSIFHKHACFFSKSLPDCRALSPWADIQRSGTACVPLTAPETSTAPTLRAKGKHPALCKHTRPDQPSGMPHLKPHKCPSGGEVGVSSGRLQPALLPPFASVQRGRHGTWAASSVWTAKYAEMADHR